MDAGKFIFLNTYFPPLFYFNFPPFRVPFSPAQVVAKIFEYVDADRNGRLTAEELITFMHKDAKTFAYLGLNLIFLT